MRAHGVPNFPDPTSGSGGEGFSILRSPGSSIVTVDGIAVSGPAFQSAAKTCKFGPGGAGLPKLSESQEHAALVFAPCIRKHGVPNYPGPTFPASGGIKRLLPPRVTIDSPAFQQAATACGGGQRGRASNTARGGCHAQCARHESE
jgi:hypothetical protein